MSRDTQEANPLLSEQLPFPFSAIQASHVEPAIATLIPEMSRRVDKLSDPETPRTYENVLLGLDSVTEPLDTAISLVRHLESVVTTPELRAAHNAVQEPVSAFYTSIPLRPELWSSVKAVDASGEAETLTPVRKRHLEKTVRGFIRSGADLDAAGKERLEQINIELTRLTTKFTENVLDSTNAFELIITDEALLAGLPKSARMAARESARSKDKASAGRDPAPPNERRTSADVGADCESVALRSSLKDSWRLTLQAPSYTAAMTYLDDRGIRQTLWQAHNTRAASGELDNRPLVRDILRLRREKARLLGYNDFADLVLEERMAHDGKSAQTFVDDLFAKTLAPFERENRELAEWSKSLGYSSIEPWDVGYLAEKQREALYEFDEEELRPYFPLEQVMAGMFDIFSRLFSIVIVPEPRVHGWDPEVRYFRVEDLSSGLHLGGFYTDWYPRENKRGGAWMDALLTGNPDAGKPHVGVICGNLTPPVEGKPSLLIHREVETIFHEFGHLLHHLLSRVTVRELAGTSVPWDFVELPSQIMENWCMEREALNTFARHFETGKPIPESLFQKMRRARNFRSANMQMRQLGFGTVDLKLHREFDGESAVDPVAFSREILAPFSAAPLPADYAMIASFTHLFSSPVAYGSGYYSYKWAEVLDADAFTRFKKEGVFNTDTGLAYRRTILERGNSDDPAQLYWDFMGRNPDANALLIRLGLSAAA